MSADKRWRLVCYDVRDPKRYRALYKVMKGVGRRIQYSVFRCRLDDREIEQLRWNLAKILDAADSLLIIDLCPSCASRAISRNHVEDWTEKPPSFAIVGRQSPVGVAKERSDADDATTEKPREIAREGAVEDLDGRKSEQ
jgi:CRISPR-associated protein Cas2